MSISWLQITATTHRTAIAEAVFEQFGAEAITELDEGSELTVEMTPNSTPAFERARMLGLFTQGTLAEPIIAALHEALGDDVVVDTQTLENEDWASRWLAEHPPIRFGERLWVAPHNAPVEADDDAIVMRLDPGLAFGTGTHPTTRLCLAWLAEADLAGSRVVDYGCGSGILAIAAVLLGASEVVAVDIDEQALQATRENAAHNGVADKITTPAMSDITGGPFDIVLANILAKPLISLAPTLAELARPDSALVMAGLLTRQIADVRGAYEPAFVFDAPVIEDDWARLSARKTAS
ncbi:MAG: 50S ribosomal protein L11 methyltransferase [Xanthomonadales bacterium]|nr:50S ribosomal protein L11 methyltransferase [Xanthomonadales bacterium]